jgi:hypothetical protein
VGIEHRLDINYSGDICRKDASKVDRGRDMRDAIRSTRFPSLSLEIHGADIAAELLSAAESAVDTPFECLAHIRAFRPELISRLRHAVVRHGQQLVAILSFYEHRRSLVVVNRLIRVPDDVLGECAALMLEHNPRMASVTFSDLYNGTVGTRTDRIRSMTWLASDCAEVELPESYDEYMQHFGSSTRKNLRYCARRLEREFPAVSFRILERQEITEEIVTAVVELNHRRMASKGKSSGMNASYTHRLAALSQSHGVACLATDGARIVAGALCTRLGQGWTLHVIAHDPTYNHVRLGLLCLLKAVAVAIQGGARRFNFLWGVSDYKLLFGAKITLLRARRYYRSWGCQLLAIHDMKDYVLQSTRRRLSSWRARLRCCARR